ncbi:sodium transporter HKT1-like [Vigna radiata var. radiata]|uniref:Sodium transporter HKT1-like n=1 Tax=Vigna radiata var. radiata TaxID=3916 RepID=A0A1S3TJW4_VIGRR|nr:sodium transporter HKT1-like [Vigna radiata var. radiata]
MNNTLFFFSTLFPRTLRFLPLHFHPFFLHLCYFLVLSVLGFLGLKVSKPRTPSSPNDLNLFYTSVSASTTSSMVALEMELFSNSQLILLTLLMFLGGEVFTSILDLLLARNKLIQNKLRSINPSSPSDESPTNATHIELGLVSIPHPKSQNRTLSDNVASVRLKYNCLRYLTYVVLGYFVVVQFVGFSLVSLYMTVVASARQVLRKKDINVVTFSLFTVVSTFASCGFVPTNENMMVFKKNSGLLLLLLPHVFLGNALYPPCLTLVLMVLEKVTRKEEFSQLLKNSNNLGYRHLLSVYHCCLLVGTVFGLNVIQFVMFWSVEWNSEIMEGLNLYEKVIASLFQVSNSRHAGESVFDLSSISSAILVLFIVMMYLPPYTTFLPVRKEEDDAKRKRKSAVECLVFSQLSYLAIFIILVCMTESKSLKEDPLNFNVLSITLEVISAYGNVGFSMGYSCARKLKGDGTCKDSWVGFSGRWSNKGKFVLILVMFFGRLKKFNMKGGKAWHLS